MKLLYLIFFASLLVGYNCFAQNTFPVPGGNVGIGTSSPTAGLTVQLEGGNTVDGSLFLVNGVNNNFGGSATLAGIKTTAADGAEYNFLKLQNAGGTKFLINASGSVSIGKAIPLSALDVQGSVRVGGMLYSGNLDPTKSDLSNLANTGQMLIGWNRIAGYGETDFIANQGLGGFGGFAFYNHNNSNVESLVMYVRGDGNVGIGITNAQNIQNKLDVNGTIHSKAVKIDLSGWSDYVFKKDYQLPSLAEVKNYIDQNQHLPEIPSEQEMVKNGLMWVK